ncbi:MAG: hypothetical protein HC922_02335 [Leptolyngbyaceae cyanobacterium SM2_3_12]|nr:hypothetical protein [Leptolyngbyaceae cyanobacterium SM2_3_12]
MRYLTWLTATALTGLSGTTLPALGSPSATLEPKPITMVEMLTPQTPSASSLDQLAREMQRRMESGAEPASAIDIAQFPWLDALLDDNGEVNLPLGITVFDTMGATSVGFGSKF